ncbi:MAG TPA: N-acetylmuramoyl-L-alanine amidase, partial [Vicinamibacterales bacterium]|nr:N-acetylmuramoyl-L-alanine amidase [Vicinamibacterales bacterium]
SPLTLVTREGRRPVPTIVQGGRELVALDDLDSLFGVSFREDALAGGVTVSYRGRTIVASANRPMVSADGRVVTLSSPVVRSGRRWLVPIDFLSSALATIYDRRIELRRVSRLVVVGDVRLPRVSAVIASAGPPTRAEVEIAPAAPAVVAVEPGRLVVRIDADGLDLATLPGGAGLIERIRPGDQPNTVAVLLDDAAGQARASVATANNVTRVVIEVPAASESRVPSPDPGVPSLDGARDALSDSRRANPDPRSPIPDPRSPASRAWQTIAIDPGHGGDDVGVRGARGAEEKQLTLDVARRLRAMVEARLGLRVILTRDDDRALSLDERAAVANNGKANLLISLHVNGSRGPVSSGAEVFHLQLDRESAEVVRAATREGVVLPSLGGGQRRLDLVPWDLAQARYLDDSARLAEVLQEELQRQQVPMSEHPLRQAPLRLLAAANMPAALVEVAYLTNPQQEARLGTDEFKAAIAQAIFTGIVRFRAWSEEPRRP